VPLNVESQSRQSELPSLNVDVTFAGFFGQATENFDTVVPA
jgi:hypothetical protein